MKTRTATFNRFDVTMPDEAIAACSHQGACDEDVAYWAARIMGSGNRSANASPDAVRDELREYGAWDDAELADDEVNWRRIVWIATCNLNEERVRHGEGGDSCCVDSDYCQFCEEGE